MSLNSRLIASADQLKEDALVNASKMIRRWMTLQSNKGVCASEHDGEWMSRFLDAKCDIAFEEMERGDDRFELLIPFLARYALEAVVGNDIGRGCIGPEHKNGGDL